MMILSLFRCHHGICRSVIGHVSSLSRDLLTSPVSLLGSDNRGDRISACSASGTPASVGLGIRSGNLSVAGERRHACGCDFGRGGSNTAVHLCQRQLGCESDSRFVQQPDLLGLNIRDWLLLMWFPLRTAKFCLWIFGSGHCGGAVSTGDESQTVRIWGAECSLCARRSGQRPPLESMYQG